MKILVIDRDTLATQLIRSRLEVKGHTIVEEGIKNNAIALLEREPFEVVFIDPAPLNNARPVVLGIRRAVRNYPYVILMSQDMPREEALRAGANEIMIKPINHSGLEVVMENAERLTGLIKRMGDEKEDFPSAGGVIAKSAFNQLFLSCIDRADRYGERSFLVFIGIKNYQEILAMDGAYAAEYATAKLSQYLVRLRRQSDIIAQTGKNEFCLMLQRPMYETEPMEAANRFADALRRFDDICASENVKVEVAVTLVDLPVGHKHVEHVVTFTKQRANAI
ncbi:MAG: diguanylate cyclase [Alphaproteobacteria bacterium]|nr:diguanylate cyclase [Alphaproteobacteria bacterium]